MESIAWVPTSASSDLGLTIPIQVHGIQANMVQLCEVFDHEMFIPGWVFIPEDRIFITEEDVLPTIPVDIRQ